MRGMSVLWMPLALVALAPFSHASPDGSRDAVPAPAQIQACFLLFEFGVGEVRRDPSAACRTRVSPASTFKSPHARAALDSGAIAGTEEKLTYDGSAGWPESSRRDHTLASAIRHSVVWYFQQVARRLGAVRESAYLRRLSYGNMDASSGLTSFWLGGSLQVTPEEQQEFLVRLYHDALPLKPGAMNAVRRMLIEPPGVVVNAAGEQPFDAPWPKDTIISAKPGSITDHSGRGVRWLVGHVQRGAHEFVFVGCVVGPATIDSGAAIALAAASLPQERVL